MSGDGGPGKFWSFIDDARRARKDEEYEAIKRDLEFVAKCTCKSNRRGAYDRQSLVRKRRAKAAEKRLKDVAEAAQKEEEKESWRVRVTVPDGAYPGYRLLARLPNGATASFIVPEGAEPGSIIQATVPPSVLFAKTKHQQPDLPEAAQENLTARSVIRERAKEGREQGEGRGVPEGWRWHFRRNIDTGQLETHYYNEITGETQTKPPTQPAGSKDELALVDRLLVAMGRPRGHPIGPRVLSEELTEEGVWVAKKTATPLEEAKKLATLEDGWDYMEEEDVDRVAAQQAALMAKAAHWKQLRGDASAQAKKRPLGPRSPRAQARSKEIAADMAKKRFERLHGHRGGRRSKILQGAKKTRKSKQKPKKTSKKSNKSRRTMRR